MWFHIYLGVQYHKQDSPKLQRYYIRLHTFFWLNAYVILEPLRLKFENDPKTF